MSRLMLPAIRFKSLRTRLAVLYTGLFAVVLICVSIALFAIVERNATEQVRGELVASSTVFDRLWAQRSAELQDAAQLLAHDFGFRAAVATGDKRTAESALGNLKGRLRVPMAFIVGIDGSVTGIANPRARAEAAALWQSLDEGATVGVASLGGGARELVAAPIMAPALTGWVVFAADLDEREMKALERLSAIPLTAAVYQRSAGGGWIDASRGGAAAEPAVARFIAAGLGSANPSDLDAAEGSAIALAKPLKTFPGAPQSVLLLRYPMSRALAAYRELQWAIALTGLFGLAITIFATWRMARSITRPISLLDAAADRLATGEEAAVAVEGEDELARLAESFNRMAVGIAERERRITHLALNDILTGLPNRALFHQHLDHRLRLVERRSGSLAVLCLDLDDFKSVNDTLGHPVGDELLRRTADRLSAEFGEGFIARLGGDEFVIVHAVGEGSDAPDILARRALAVVGTPIHVEGHELSGGASIGIALAPVDGTDSRTLLKNAELALYRAKEGGRGGYCFFEESMNERAQERRQIESDLRRALSQGQFELYFQPLFDLAKDRIGAFEALLRWHHPTRGIVSPVEFVPVAEETGLIVDIGAWVIREACKQAMKWPDNVRVAVNVSSVQFRRPGLAEIVLQALTANGLRPDRLELEITESIFLEESDAILQMLHSLRALGVRIALDDFGTGYSSLSYLQRFPFDKIKIDRSFIQNLLTRPGAAAIVRAITDLAGALGMETTAEGVEESEQLAELRLHGCSSVQGYLFSRPIDARAVQVLLAGQDKRPARLAG